MLRDVSVDTRIRITTELFSEHANVIKHKTCHTLIVRLKNYLDSSPVWTFQRGYSNITPSGYLRVAIPNGRRLDEVTRLNHIFSLLQSISQSRYLPSEVDVTSSDSLFANECIVHTKPLLFKRLIFVFHST
jgi:hypothetical protein